jgi:hypothetical protein
LSLVTTLGSGGGGGSDGSGDTTVPITTASPPGGIYDATQLVTLTSNETATIYYTTDGSTPSIGGSTTISGTSPVSLQVGPGVTTLQFFGVDSAGNQETIKTETYSIASASGTWVGSYSSELFADTALSLTLTQTGASVSGSYTTKAGDYGTFSATVIGTTFDMTITSSNPDCPASYTGSGTTDGVNMNFTFIGMNCLGAINNGVGSATYQVGTVLDYGLPGPYSLLHSGSDLLWQDLSEAPIKMMPAAGGTSQALTQKLGVPIDMVIQGSNMVWVDYRPSGGSTCIPEKSQVLNMTSLDGTTSKVLASGNRCNLTPNIVLDNDNAYWVTTTASPNEYTLQQIPLDGSPAVTLTTTLQPIVAMARDDSYLYWVEGRFPDPGVIKRIPLAGGSVTDVATVTNGIVGNILINGSDLIVTEIVYPYPDNYRILKIATSDGSATILATRAQSPYPLKLTADATTLYWFDSAGIYSLPMSGGSVTTLATISGTPSDITVDTSNVIWLENDGFVGSIFEIPKVGGTPSVMASDLFTPYGGVLTTSASKLYFTEGDYNTTWYGRIAEMPLSGGAVASFVTGITGGAGSMVTDGNSIFVVDGWRILKMPIAGGHLETLARANFYIEDLATDGIYVYWLEGGPYQPIKRIPVDGGLVETLATSSNFAEAIATDGTYVYWSESLDTIQRVSINGGVVTTVVSTGIVSDFISDGLYLYISDVSNNAIQRVSINGGAVTTLAGLDYGTVWASLALDDTSVYSLSNVEMIKVPKAGGVASTLIPGGFTVDIYDPSSLVVDATKAYWTEFAGGTIKSTPK